ncbi:MAG: hypothetical protein RIS45_1606, partial [Planctomycetota bacterium]
MNGPTDGAPSHGSREHGHDAQGRDRQDHESSLPAMDQIGPEQDGAVSDGMNDEMNIEVPGEAEFLDDPGAGFGFADADELAAEQSAELEAA